MSIGLLDFIDVHRLPINYNSLRDLWVGGIFACILFKVALCRLLQYLKDQTYDNFLPIESLFQVNYSSQFILCKSCNLIYVFTSVVLSLKEKSLTKSHQAKPTGSSSDDGSEDGLEEPGISNDHGLFDPPLFQPIQNESRKK